MNPNNVLNRVLHPACRKAEVSRKLAQFPVPLFNVGHPKWRKHQGASVPVGPHGFAAHPFRVHTADA